MSTPLHLTIGELAAGAIDRLLDSGLEDSTPPLAVVELDDGDGDGDEIDGAVRRLATTDRIVIGAWRDAARPPGRALAPVLQALDTTYSVHSEPGIEAVTGDVDAAVELLAALHARRPEAMRIFASTLRITAGLPLPAALEVESLAYSTLLASPEHHDWLATRRATAPVAPPPPVARAVLIDRRADELRLTLHRPERRNAFGAQLRNELVSGLQLALADAEIRTVTIDGAGPAFCSGGDLGEFGDTADHAASHLIRTRGGPARLIHQLGDRVRFRVHGACVGAGTELPSVGAHVTADPGAFFRLPEIEMGLIPGAGGTAGLPARIGRWRAFALCASHATIDATAAKSWGLVDEIRDIAEWDL